MFRMTWGIRRIAFTIGAMLLVGGWGLTGYVDAYQHAAGAAAGQRWRDGEQEPVATIRPSSREETESGAAPAVASGSSSAFRAVSRSKAAAALTLTRQITPPSSWLYGLGVLTMMGGAGLMALTVPWRGARLAAAAEFMPQPRHQGSPPPKAPSGPAPPPSFAGIPAMSQAPSAPPPPQPPPEAPARKGGIKPLRFKKGA